MEIKTLTDESIFLKYGKFEKKTLVMRVHISMEWIVDWMLKHFLSWGPNHCQYASRSDLLVILIRHLGTRWYVFTQPFSPLAV